MGKHFLLPARYFCLRLGFLLLKEDRLGLLNLQLKFDLVLFAYGVMQFFVLKNAKNTKKYHIT